MSSEAAAVMQCYLVNSVSIDPLEQCKFLIDNNCLEDESFIDYVYLIYCRIAISAVADDFLCTSLLTVSKNLRMSDSLAGITLLAFGNGCPDIFSSIAAANDSRSEMIIGELLGAGIFCTSVVSGLVFINSNFKLACRPIFRDTSFYLLAVYLIWCYSWNGEITFYGALSFIIIYLVYLTVAFCGQLLGSRLRGNYVLEHQASDSVANLGIQFLKCARMHEENGCFKRRPDSVKKSLGADDCKAAKANQQARPIIRVDYKEGGVTCVHLKCSNICSHGSQPELQAAKRDKQPLEVQLFSSSLKSSTGKPGFTNQAFVSESEAHANQQSKSRSHQQPSTMFLGASQHHPHLPTCAHHHHHQKPPAPLQARAPSPELSSRIFALQAANNSNNNHNNKPTDMYQLEGAEGGSEWDSFLAHINPIESTDWRTISLTSKIIRILRAPMVLVGQLTIPIVDNQKILNNWCRPLNALHFITVPLFIMLSTGLGLGGGNPGEPAASGAGCNWWSLSGLFGMPAPVAELLLATLLAAYLFLLTSPHQAPKYHAAFAYVGFGMSVFWVYLLASEMISLMKTIGLVFGMSDTAIGLGILAWGNSLGDIVANYSLTKANYPRMALGACIGAPLLNLLLGFGLSFTISLKPGQSSAIQYSPTITLLCSTLAIILLSLMLTTLLPANASKRPIGYLLIGGYLLYFMAAVCLEYKLINL